MFKYGLYVNWLFLSLLFKSGLYILRLAPFSYAGRFCYLLMYLLPVVCEYLE